MKFLSKSSCLGLVVGLIVFSALTYREHLREGSDKQAHSEQEPACQHHYRASYYVNSKESRAIAEDPKKLWDIFDLNTVACERESACLWEIEVLEDGNYEAHCILRDH